MKNKNSTDFLLGRETLTTNYRYIQRSLSKILDILLNQEMLKDMQNLPLIVVEAP